MATRILVIEDNDANLELVRYLLEASGYDVLCAVNGALGVALAQREHPDLVISDLGMPVMDGYEVVHFLRSDPKCHAMPIIALTAYSMPGDRDRVMQAGFDGYLAKPIEPELFVRQIEAFLPEARRHPGPAPER